MQENSGQDTNPELKKFSNSREKVAANFAQDGEQYRNNARVLPRETIQEATERIALDYPGMDVRLETEHVVDGYGNAMDAREFTEKAGLSGDETYVGVYTKPKIVADVK